MFLRTPVAPHHLSLGALTAVPTEAARLSAWWFNAPRRAPLGVEAGHLSGGQMRITTWTSHHAFLSAAFCLRTRPLSAEV